MAVIKPIRSESDYNDTLARIDEIFGAEVGTPESDECDVLVDLVELYEQRHYPVGLPSVGAALEFHMDQTGMKPRDLVAFLGSRAKVSEVLSGKRQLTMSMARALHQHLGIPAEVLLQEPGADFETPLDEFEPRKFPTQGNGQCRLDSGCTEPVRPCGRDRKRPDGDVPAVEKQLCPRYTGEMMIGASTPRLMNMRLRPGAGRLWHRQMRDG